MQAQGLAQFALGRRGRHVDLVPENLALRIQKCRLTLSSNDHIMRHQKLRYRFSLSEATNARISDEDETPLVPICAKINHVRRKMMR